MSSAVQGTSRLGPESKKRETGRKNPGKTPGSHRRQAQKMLVL